MKVVSDRLIEVQEVNEALGIRGLSLSVSVIKMSSQVAQVVVCDPNLPVFTNLVCIMNMEAQNNKKTDQIKPLESKVASTVLVDDHGNEL